LLPCTWLQQWTGAKPWPRAILLLLLLALLLCLMLLLLLLWRRLLLLWGWLRVCAVWLFVDRAPGCASIQCNSMW
jgi:hypothetical protein